LDLDRTLISAATFDTVASLGVQKGLEQVLRGEADLPEVERTLFRLDGMKYWIKLRPGYRLPSAAALQALPDLGVHQCHHVSFLIASIKIAFTMELHCMGVHGSAISGIALMCHVHQEHMASGAYDIVSLDSRQWQLLFSMSHLTCCRWSKVAGLRKTRLVVLVNTPAQLHECGHESVQHSPRGL